MLRNYTKVIQQPQGGEDQSPLNRTFTYIMFTHHKYLIYDSLSVLCPLVIIAGCGPRSCAHKRGHAGDVEVHKNTGHVPAISKKGPIKICVFNLNWWISSPFSLVNFFPNRHLTTKMTPETCRGRGKFGDVFSARVTTSPVRCRVSANDGIPAAAGGRTEV